MQTDTLSVLRLVLASLTCYRLAQLITLDKGPLLIFERLRWWIEYYIAASPKRQQSTFWSSLADGLSCPYCMGFYLGMPCALLVLFPTTVGDLLLLWLGIVGAQAFLQGVSNRE